MTEAVGSEEAMRLSENALTVLEKRYLARDSDGGAVESPRGLFERVARNVAMMDILYHERSYDAGGGSDLVDPGERTKDELPESSYLSPWDVDTLYRAYRRLAGAGHMKLEFDELCRLAEEEKEAVIERAAGFFAAMTGRHFLPNSPTLMNAGRELQQLSACFVLPIDDSMESIFESIKNAALIHKSGGGTGFSFSKLRPKNDVVRTTGGIASGPVSFLKVFNSATEAVKQGGTRRGANMGMLRVDHPDILEFITCKEDNDAITNFNLSVAITDEFMRALARDEDYALLNPRDGAEIEYLSARMVYDLIVEMAWKNGEPGVIFIDRINAENPTPGVGEIESTNPCGEQPLLPYESCNLGSLNLSELVKEGAWWDVGGDLPGDLDEVEALIDWDRLEEMTDLAVHFLDNVIDANRYPIPEIAEMTHANRKIGLGVMGFAEMLLKLGVPYDGELAVELGHKVMRFIDERGKESSARLAEFRGAFPNFPESRFAREEDAKTLRNATVTTIAPTGTISIIGGTSGGIEPLFSIAFTRNVLDGEKLVESNPVFEEVARRRGFYSDSLALEIAEGTTLSEIPEVPEDVKRVFVTALDIDPKWHIEMQAAFQAGTDNAVSKTINFPEDTTREEIGGAFRRAYESGCKGLTVYRNASRSEQVLVVGSSKKAEEKVAVEGEPASQWGKIQPLSRTSRLPGITVRKATPMGNLFLTMNVYGGHPFELFAQIGKAGSDVTAFTETIARLISLAFRSGVDPMVVADQLIGIGGSRSVGFGPNRVRSVPDAIGQFIREVLENPEEFCSPSDDGDSPTQLGLARLAEPDNEKETSRGNPGHSAGKRVQHFALCPACGLQALVYEEGCVKCLACGHSEC